MDFEGLSEQEATGWKRGLYQGVKRTFRAPVVNAVIRVPMAEAPEITRYAWGQIKPLFETRAFAEYAVAYRDAVLSPVEGAFDLPTYSPGDLGIGPGEFRELQGQTAAFDVVQPRLAVVMELLDRGVHDEPIGQDSDLRDAATEPLPGRGARERARAPTLVDVDDASDELADVIDAIQAYHGFETGLATIHRCHAQWPAFLAAAWDDIQPVLASDAYDQAVEDAAAQVTDFVDSVPYRPQLAPDALERIGGDEDSIERVQEIARAFNRGAPRSVIRTIPLYAALAGVVGPRSL